MLRRSISFLTVVFALFVAVSFLGGSAFWIMLGVWDDLSIDGRAEVVTTPPPELGESWRVYGGDAKGTRYAKADQITPANVGELEVVWSIRTGALDGRESVGRRSAFETTPILIGDQLIFCTQFTEVISVDPATGEELWRFDPEVGLERNPANQYTCRGVSYWVDGLGARSEQCSTRIFVGTVDSRLIALDAKTGTPCTAFGDGGAIKVEPNMPLRWPGEYQITSAPAIIDDLVITGSAISDNLRTDAPTGTVHAFDARTGALRWRFNPIPQIPDDPAWSSWADGSAARTGHTNVWSTIAVDHERGLVFLPTSSPSPDYYGGNRVGDNRYANSLVALRAATGEVVWHFQAVHHDVWDYDLPAQPGLYQVTRDGKIHDVVAQITKMGLIFVLDRETGEPFLPIEERPVPQDAAHGEVLSPTQPFPAQTPPLVPTQLDPSDAFGVTLWDKRACASKIRKLRRDGLYTPPVEEGTLAYPFQGGGGNWGSAAFDPARNLLVVNMSNLGGFVELTPKEGERPTAQFIADDAEFAPMEGAPYTMRRSPLLSPLGLPCTPPPWGILAGVDLSTGEIVWRQVHGTTEDLTDGLVALKTGTPTFGGPIITSAGLVFIGAAMDNYLRAFDVETGEELWKGRLPAGAQATPMTYTYQGQQYVVIAAVLRRVFDGSDCF
ncbi:MAG: pyrroloquinoline quinone-dependent dehydrogenase, partial [Pseudomonadota bacterium]